MLKFIIISISLMVSGSTVAQSLSETGRNEDLVRRALDAGAAGKCPADLMGPMLRGACLQQMPAMGQRLAAMGTINGMQFLGMQPMPNGPAVEVYRVTFSGGGSMVWVANSGPDGKLVALFSNG